jgi:hypothetical protein
MQVLIFNMYKESDVTLDRDRSRNVKMNRPSLIKMYVISSIQYCIVYLLYFS